MSDELLVRIAPVLPSIPTVAIYLVGLGYALMQRKRHPKAARLAVAGLGALLLQQLLTVWTLFMDLKPSADEDVRALARGVAAIVWVGYASSLIGTTLLIAAVFAGRNGTKVRADA